MRKVCWPPIRTLAFLMSFSHQSLLVQSSEQDVYESHKATLGTLPLEDMPQFTYEPSLLLAKRGKLTVPIKAPIDIGGTSHIVVTSEILKDENYRQFHKNMGTA